MRRLKWLSTLNTVTIVITVQFLFCQHGSAAEKVRRPVVAGQFYPASPKELSGVIDEFLAKPANAQIDGRVRALIVPHAGYIYSGQVAAAGFKLLSPKLSRFIILASNHSAAAPYFKFSLGEVDFFQTPLGKVKVSSIRQELLKNNLFSLTPEAQDSHIIEVELPFLQKKYAEFEIMPIVTGWVGSQDIEEAAKLIAPYLDEKTALIVSSDLSHYHPYKRAVELDTACIKALAQIDLEQAAECEACGLPAALILLKIAKEQGWRGKIIEYKNSGDTAGNKAQVVGYAAIAFYQGAANKPPVTPHQTEAEEHLSAGDKDTLLKLARQVLESYIKTGSKPEVESALSTMLLKKSGCFVTLKKSDELRGCIGHLTAKEPLYQCVSENTINAAVHDGRFPPVTAPELKDIEIEISVLTTPKPLKNEGPDKLLAALVPLKHGVILQRGLASATFLPQVWEQLPKKEDFLTHLCLKGGMSGTCWKDPATEIQTYEALVFKEEKQ